MLCCQLQRALPRRLRPAVSGEQYRTEPSWFQVLLMWGVERVEGLYVLELKGFGAAAFQALIRGLACLEEHLGLWFRPTFGLAIA